MIYNSFGQQDYRNFKVINNYLLNFRILICLLILCGLIFSRGILRKDLLLEFFFFSSFLFFFRIIIIIVILITFFYSFRVFSIFLIIKNNINFFKSNKIIILVTFNLLLFGLI